jgi:DNA replication protein DnaC
MKLTGMAQALSDQMKNTDFNDYSFEERLGLLVEYEWTYRQNKRLAILLKQAKLRLGACMEDINYIHPRKLDRGLMKSLATCQWINARQNVIITGPTGIGKTFIACALANAACRIYLAWGYLSS